MIRLPKMSDPADLMMRNSLHRGTPPQIRKPGSGLTTPSIPPAVGKVDNLMPGYTRQELATLINRQQGLAEQIVENIRENQQENLQAPSSAMEEYYMAVLKNIRQKEQMEIERAYLTQQQKNDLQASALARKAGIDGDLVRRADELAERDADIDTTTEREEERDAESERRSAMLPSSSAPGGPDDDEMGAAVAGASAAGASAKQTRQVEVARSVIGPIDTLIENIPIDRPTVAKKYVSSQHSRILSLVSSVLTRLKDADIMKPGTVSLHRIRLANALKAKAGGDVQAVRSLLMHIKHSALSFLFFNEIKGLSP